MRGWYLCAMMLCSFTAASQDDVRKNNKPEIIGQRQISTEEDHPVEIHLTHLYVVDVDDWWYPVGFTLDLYEGRDYTLSGHTVVPRENFFGTLTVPVTVNDGDDDSRKYDLKIEVNPVNDRPVITDQESVSMEQGGSFAILLSYLSVTDPDNEFPEDFSLVLPQPEGNTYTVSGNIVTPHPDFHGKLLVSLQVNDGRESSAAFAFEITVLPANERPVIVGQTTAATDEDTSFTIEFSHLVVRDPDSEYPGDFELHIEPGPNYTYSGQVVTPTPDFSGQLVVSIRVNDGHRDSDPFPFSILLRPINDVPVIRDVEEDILGYEPGDAPVFIAEHLNIFDPDNDTLAGAELAFQPGRYIPGGDQLQTATLPPSIRSSFDLVRGVLALSGAASAADYVRALRSVEYNFAASSGLQFENKVVSITVTDGRATSNVVTREIGGPEVVVDLDIPSAFTPNGDAANDTWRITPLERSEELSGAVIRVYNKAGYLLFESVGFEKEWDGKLNGQVLPSDTYFYTIDLNLASSRRSLKGIVAILR